MWSKVTDNTETKLASNHRTSDLQMESLIHWPLHHHPSTFYSTEPKKGGNIRGRVWNRVCFMAMGHLPWPTPWDCEFPLRSKSEVRGAELVNFTSKLWSVPIPPPTLPFCFLCLHFKGLTNGMLEEPDLLTVPLVTTQTNQTGGEISFVSCGERLDIFLKLLKITL